MHPKMMIALARGVEQERNGERQQLQVRSQVVADHGRGSSGSRLQSRRVPRLVLRPRPRLS